MHTQMDRQETLQKLKVEERKQSVETGQFSSNFRADVEALKMAEEMLLTER